MRQLETPQGNYFEDFSLGQVFHHGVPRTITEADATLYTALTGSRYVLHCADTIAKECGFQSMPLDNFLVFHIAFGKTVNDISLNAVANLGYAEVDFKQACFAGDTLAVTSEVIGLKENSNGKNGVVFVRSTAVNQKDLTVVSWIRWVMVEKKIPHPPSMTPVIPDYLGNLNAENLAIPPNAHFSDWRDHYSDNQYRFDDIEIGDNIFHRDGLTINQSDHSLATRLYQNNARVHFDQHAMNTSRHGKRLVYGGHIISLCRALSYNGLGNAVWLCAINGGTHANPSFAGDTIYCQSEIIDKRVIPSRDDVAMVRVRMLGVKNDSPDNMEFLYRQDAGRTTYHTNLVLDLDYWVMMLR
ncbi:MaoC family dehydratase [Aliikangiella coralliicola]|uniref:MaoC family dehydratase n=1 Tax=Aliikangiella coralliicola TaxID=2592383 RepID=A0A545UJX6_9GAMM|nr:MaoC family dehydratase [Aliikangiella coralliicola]TQV89761.1 MaoC family dehydratase [Aliikangiella coralliicola]